MANDVVETPLLKKLNEQRVAAAFARKEYLERAAEGEEPSAEDTASFEKANRDIDRYGALIAAEIKRQKEERSYAADFAAAFGKSGSTVDNEKTDKEKEAEATLAEKMREDLRASRQGETRSGGMYQPIPDPRVAAQERRDLLAGSAGKGAEMVPVTLVRALYEKLFDDSAILAAGPTILRTQSGEQLKLPRLTALGALSQANARVAEAGPIIEGDPTFDQVLLDAYKYAQFTQVSRELVEDGVLDIESLIGTVLGRNIANYVGYDLTLGTGTGQPRGVRTLVPGGNTVSTTHALSFGSSSFDLFFDTIAKLKPGYRRGAKWLVNDTSMFSLRKLKMNSQYAWEPNLQGAGQPDTFLGYPILADPNMPAAAAANLGIVGIFGDFSAYYVRLVKDVRVEWSMEYAWVNDLLSVKAVLRADGDAIDDAAFAAIALTA
jgi:HK97 family phage major capsid protein